MLDYLSTEWIDRLRTVALDDDDLRRAASGADVTLQQVVTAAPQGEVAYYVTLDDGDVYVQAGRARRADVTFEQDYRTAVSVATGELNALDAVRDGRVLLTGDPTVLSANVEAFKALDTVFAAVRTETAYPDPPSR